jgi:hypothetical protein
MFNTHEIIAQFKSEHAHEMLALSITRPNIDIYNEAQFYRALFSFVCEVNAVVRLDGKARRGVSIYEDYWHAACALMPDDVARTDLLHALLFIYITSQGHDVLITREWATRRGTVLGRLINERTLASEVVNALRREAWLDVDAIETLIKRGDVFDS